MEVCVDSVESALNAAKGGAARIELCSALSEGGLTPSLGLFRQVKTLIRIPVFVMIRPRRGDFCYSNEEIEVMRHDITALKNSTADGFVFGVLTSTGEINSVVCFKLVSLAEPIPCTFHRAFDVALNPEKLLQPLIDIGFTRLLTSGQAKSAELGAPLIKKLIDEANDRIIVMPGAGITMENLRIILEKTGAREFHASARKPVLSKMKYVNQCCNMGDNCDEYKLLITDQFIVENMVAEAKLVWGTDGS